MHPDDEVCLCFHVPLRKIQSFLKREDPPVASLISECLGAGTGCQWCVPFLKHLHAQHQKGTPVDLRISPERYAAARGGYRQTGQRDPQVVSDAAPDAAAPGTTPPPSSPLTSTSPAAPRTTPSDGAP
jgi:bacterioferritin-associated ferredoxin